MNPTIIGNATLYNCDCMELMKDTPDKYYELAIVDPPYGINFGAFNRTNRLSTGSTIKANNYKNSEWDKSIPTDDYFIELKRVSKNQIIWGGNYFPILWINGCKGFIYWHKGNPVQNFSDGELAYTSFDRVAKQFNFRYYGNIEGNTSASSKVHPTQKPIKLYEWLLTNYAKTGDKILDTHGGSFSSAIACNNLGFDFTGIELDADYYDAAVKLVTAANQQLRMFA